MSVKKRFPNFRKFYPFYEESPGKFLAATDVDSCLYHIFFDTSQSQHRILRDSKCCNKTSVAFNSFQVCHLKIQQRYLLQEEVNVSKREISSLVDSLSDFLKFLDKESNCLQFALLKPKYEIGSTKSKDNLFARYNKDVFEFRKRQIHLPCRFQNTIPACFPSIRLNYMAINLFLQKLSTLTIAKLTTSTRTDITLPASVNKLKRITTCSAFTRDSWNKKNIINFIGSEYCPNGMCSEKFCLHEKNFQSFQKVIVSVLLASPPVKCAIFPLRNKQCHFSCSLTKGFTFLKKRKNQIKLHCPTCRNKKCV